MDFYSLCSSNTKCHSSCIRLAFYIFYSCFNSVEGTYKIGDQMSFYHIFMTTALASLIGVGILGYADAFLLMAFGIITIAFVHGEDVE